MEEELNEHDLEERLYAMLHHVDETQNNLTDSLQNKIDTTLFDDGPRSTLRRYWRTGADYNPYQKLNRPEPKEPTQPPSKATPTQKVYRSEPKDPILSAAKPTAIQKVNRLETKNPVPLTKTIALLDNTQPKEESISPNPPSPVDLSLFQSPIPQNVKATIEYMDDDDNPVLLETSDEDEVVEVALPPKPTITIESSDEDELQIVKPKSPTKTDPKAIVGKSSSGERAVSSSPVPSVVSSVSDEFIRSDCIALNISSRHPDKHSFDFSLHGSDLLIQNTPKKKKRKKNKEAVTSTPIQASNEKSTVVADGCFATPKSKAKNKKQKSKLFTEKSIPIPDVYDSDSNQSIVETNKNKNPYIVTEKSLPNVDVYESDSNQSEIVKENNTDQSKKMQVSVTYSSDSSISNDRPDDVSKKNMTNSSVETVDLTNYDNYITIDNTGISENIVMGNVTGLSESLDHGDENLPPRKDISKYVSSKVPSILNEDLDFDNLKGKDKICKIRRYSLTTLRAEMEKFYNESWGGEDFNHREIQKNMSRDKSLWAIDPKDRMPSLAQRKVKCNYCNRVGHRDDTCRQKPPVCYMCGNTGHFEPRCPSKICVNCGAPNFMYSTMCRNCSSWHNLRCGECGQSGHPSSHCPDVWRRYHNTISMETTLETCQPKKYYQLYCSGCSRRGHLVHTCRVTLPFSGLPLNSPFVRFYRPIYGPKPRSKSFSQEASTPDQRKQIDKRLSKSPMHETHQNKKKNLSLDDNELHKSTGQKITTKETESTPRSRKKSFDAVEKEVSESVPIRSSNHDNKGHVIQDNEVSDTSDAVTSARIYVTDDIIAKLKTKDGEDWLKETSMKLNVVVGHSDVNSFLNIKGKLADQETFQTELREWTQPTKKIETTTCDMSQSEDANTLNNIPKNRNNLLRQLSKALNSLSEDLGDPKALFKELTFSQNKHEQLLKKKIISPKTLTNSRTHINDVLKKLNTILLGQAGLADGGQHVKELVSFKQMLQTSRQKTIPQTVRKEIAEHYHIIFSPSARNDYMDLVKKYYLHSRSATKLKKKKKKSSQLKQNQKSNNVNVNKSNVENTAYESESIGNIIPSKNNEDLKNTSNGKSMAFTKSQKAELLNMLVSYHRKLTSKEPLVGPITRKAKFSLSQKLHSFIRILFQNEFIPSKIVKKARRVQKEAQEMLANV